MSDPSVVPDLSAFSTQLADAVERAAAWTVTVKARPGPAASGIAIGPDLVVTADHVIDPVRESAIRLRAADGREIDATLLGRDPLTDLAVLRTAERGLITAAGAPAEPRVGSIAVAVARPQQVAASLGLIAGLGGPARTRRGGLLDRFIQVDVVLYPGFSGGPLIDPSGAVLGMNTSGLAFGGPDIAIPWDQAINVAQLIAEHGVVRRGYLGIGGQPVALTGAAQALIGGQDRGLLVVQVVEGGPAARAGLLQGDIIVRLGGSPVTSADDLQAHLGPSRVGASIMATVLRGSHLTDCPITVGQRE
ncbi:MAG TPA: trypsin-like peptidase domain-containing protein [Dehalococcoidia bacterium]|nr:trypsin-like peptidase domain-containing protein [Dehalococcoidia bacterium]